MKKFISFKNFIKQLLLKEGRFDYLMEFEPPKEKTKKATKHLSREEEHFLYRRFSDEEKRKIKTPDHYETYKNETLRWYSPRAYTIMIFSFNPESPTFRSSNPTHIVSFYSPSNEHSHTQLCSGELLDLRKSFIENRNSININTLSNNFRDKKITVNNINTAMTFINYIATLEESELNTFFSRASYASLNNNSTFGRIFTQNNNKICAFWNTSNQVNKNVRQLISTIFDEIIENNNVDSDVNLKTYKFSDTYEMLHNEFINMKNVVVRNINQRIPEILRQLHITHGDAKEKLKDEYYQLTGTIYGGQ